MLPTTLECSLDAKHRYDPNELQTTCPVDGAPLLVVYAQPALRMDAVATGPWSMWRYREMLPVEDGDEPVSLGEGCTPLVATPRLADALRIDVPLFVKDESQNPTASFKSRGMSVAVTRAKRLGATALVAPSAGNAGGALAAYGARAGLPVTVFLPRDTPAILVEEARSFGARVELVDGLIDDAGRLAAGFADRANAYRGVSPYTGGWNGYGPERPAMVCVQAEGCAPIVRAFAAGDDASEHWADANTAAWGLRVPGALGDRLMLRALRASGGTAVAVGEEALLDGMAAIRTLEGIDASEEGGAAYAAIAKLVAARLRFDGPVVLFNTGSALKYAPRGTFA